jgi:hypothetical protein
MADKMEELASKAAEAFAKGNIIGGIGIVGVLLLVTAIPLIELAQSPIYQSPHLYLGLLFGLAGCTFVLVSALLYRERISIRKDTLITMMSGYAEVSAQLASKVDTGAVAVGRITDYADQYFGAMVKLLKSGEKSEG